MIVSAVVRRRVHWSVSWLVVLSVLGSGECHADEFDDLLGGIGGEPATGTRLLKGFVELSERQYTEDRGATEFVDAQTSLWAEAEWEADMTASISTRINGRAYVNSAHRGFSRYDLPEAYVHVDHGSMDLRVGNFAENWGIADAYNPLDVLNSRDFATDLLEPLRRGQGGMRFRWLPVGSNTFGEPTLSVYYLPFYRPARYAPAGQRVSPATFGALDSPGTSGLSASEETFSAARFQSTLNTKFMNADIQAILSRGPDRDPPVTTTSPGTLAVVQQRVDTVGLGARVAPSRSQTGAFLSSLIMKLEITRRQFEAIGEAMVPTSCDYTGYVIGVDREWARLVSEHDALLMTLEYAGEAGGNPTDRRPFEHDWIARAFWQANNHNRTTVEARLLADTEDEDVALELTISSRLARLNEALQFQLQGRWFQFGSRSESPLANAPSLSAVSATIRWDFGR